MRVVEVMTVSKADCDELCQFPAAAGGALSRTTFTGIGGYRRIPHKRGFHQRKPV